MKKIYLFITTFVVAVLFNLNDVFATQTCVYGKQKDDGSWEKQITISVEDWDNYEIVNTNSDSPMLDERIALSKNTKSGIDYFYGTEKIDNKKHEEYIYLYIYPNREVYEFLDKDCPSVLNYEYRLEGSYQKNYAIYISQDDLSEETKVDVNKWYTKVDGFWDFFKSVKESESGYFVEESVKDVDIEELLDESECTTYSTGITSIRATVEQNKNKSCDNNPDFDRKYQKLSELCEAFRATSTYAESTGEALMAKSCSTACSALRDDIAEICKTNTNDSGCGSLGSKIINWIYKIIRMVRYAIPVLIILLTVLEYIKALAADSEDEMKKVTGKFARRLIVAALIFIIPFILDFLLKIFSIPGLNDPFCAN